jgi:hypothetical protein
MHSCALRGYHIAHGCSRAQRRPRVRHAWPWAHACSGVRDTSLRRQCRPAVCAWHAGQCRGEGHSDAEMTRRGRFCPRDGYAVARCKTRLSARMEPRHVHLADNGVLRGEATERPEDARSLCREQRGPGTQAGQECVPGGTLHTLTSAAGQGTLGFVDVSREQAHTQRCRRQ